MELDIFDLGSEMIYEAKKLLGLHTPEERIYKKILDLPRSTLTQLRATIFERTIPKALQSPNSIIAMHATFRWENSLMLAFDADYINRYEPDSFIVMSGKIPQIKANLKNNIAWRDKLTDDDLQIWQDEEIFITQLLAGYRMQRAVVFDNNDSAANIFNYITRKTTVNPPRNPPKPMQKTYKTIFVTAPSGLGAKEYLKAFSLYAQNKGIDMGFLDIGAEVFAVARAEDAAVTEDNILDYDVDKLSEWRSKAFANIMRKRLEQKHCIILSHATFRDKKKTYSAFDPNLEIEAMDLFNPDAFVTLLDDLLSIKVRLFGRQRWRDQKISLKEIGIWREEEAVVTRLMADNWNRPHYLVAIQEPFDTLFNLVFTPQIRRIYLSYPISEIISDNDADKFFAEVRGMRDLLRSQQRNGNPLFVAYDPFDLKDSATLMCRNPKTTFPYTLKGHLTEFGNSVSSKDLKVEKIDGAIAELRISENNTSFTIEELQDAEKIIKGQIVERATG